MLCPTVDSLLIYITESVCSVTPVCLLGRLSPCVQSRRSVCLEGSPPEFSHAGLSAWKALLLCSVTPVCLPGRLSPCVQSRRSVCSAGSPPVFSHASLSALKALPLTISKTTHSLCLVLDASSNISTSPSQSTPSTFHSNMLYKTLYLLLLTDAYMSTLALDAEAAIKHVPRLLTWF